MTTGTGKVLKRCEPCGALYRGEAHECVEQETFGFSAIALAVVWS